MKLVCLVLLLADPSVLSQGLASAITDYSRLRSNPHNLYLACRRDPGSSWWVLLLAYRVAPCPSKS